MHRGKLIVYLDRCCLWYWELFLDYIEYSLLNVPPHGEGAGGADKYIAASDGRPLGLTVARSVDGRLFRSNMVLL